jgi:hypothetical protein
MVEIPKVQRFWEKDFRMRDADVRTQEEQRQLIEALRHGNIYEVFAKSPTFKISDFHEFFAQQHKTYKGEILKDGEIIAASASYHGPDARQFHQHQPRTVLSQEDVQYLGKSFMESGQRLTSEDQGQGQVKMQLLAGEGEGEMGGGAGGKFKAATTGKAKAAQVEGEPMTQEQVEEAARGTLDDWQQFMDDQWSTMFDAQLMHDYQSHMNEIKQEVQRILALVKSGAIDPVFALIALTKVNATKNGFLMTGLGQKAFHINESLGKISQDLQGSGFDYGKMEMAREKSRDGAFQLNLLMTDMQKVMQDTAGTMEFVKGFMEEWNRHKREIVTKFAAH